MFAARPACCQLVKEAEETNENTQQDGLKPAQKEHSWLDPQLIEKLPVNIRKGKDGKPLGTDRTVI